MNAVIENLQPHETSLLYNALLFFKSNSEDAFAHTVLDEPENGMQKIFYNYMQDELKKLIEKLFGDMHVSEMDFTNHFNQWYKQMQQNRITEKPATA